MKLNKDHDGKEFKNFFRVIGKVKPVRKKEDNGDWVDVSFYQTTLTQTLKDRRVLQFVVETANYNELKVELAGMEYDFAYAYSSTEKKSHKLKWVDRLDKDKYPNETYHLISPEWDKAEEYSKIICTDKYLDIRGHYEFSKFKNDEGQDKNYTKRVIDNIYIIEDGQEIKFNGNKIKYVCDFNSPDFIEVNYFDLEIGIKSCYQDEDTNNTKVNATILSYGKEQSKINDVELIIYDKEAEEGKISLANAFNSLERLDFVEVLGIDNNRVIKSEVDAEVEITASDPFANVDSSNKRTRKEWLITGNKKGLEITEYVEGTLQRKLLTEEEIEDVALMFENIFD